MKNLIRDVERRITSLHAELKRKPAKGKFEKENSAESKLRREEEESVRNFTEKMHRLLAEHEGKLKALDQRKNSKKVYS